MSTSSRFTLSALALALLGAGAMYALAQPAKEPEKKPDAPAAPAKPAETPAADAKAAPASYETPDGSAKLPVLSRRELTLVIEDLKIGDGAEANINSTISVLYHGQFKDGSVLDSTRDKGNQPYTLPVRRFIQGWHLGVPGMKVGGIRRLTIPYQLAYGDAGQPPRVPPKADLIFTIELKEVK